MDWKLDDGLLETAQLHQKPHPLRSSFLRARRPRKRQLPWLLQDCPAAHGLRNRPQQVVPGHLQELLWVLVWDWARHQELLEIQQGRNLRFAHSGINLKRVYRFLVRSMVPSQRAEVQSLERRNWTYTHLFIDLETLGSSHQKPSTHWKELSFWTKNHFPGNERWKRWSRIKPTPITKWRKQWNLS